MIMATAIAHSLKHRTHFPNWMTAIARKIASGFVRIYRWFAGEPKPLSPRERRQRRKAIVREVMKK
jgi:hypothetical protein